MSDQCPCCGHVRDEQPEPIVAACSMLVVRALELVGNRIVRLDRSRYARIEGRPRHEAHLLWQPADKMVDEALAGAWDAVPAVLAEHGCCGATPDELTGLLDRYVRDLLQQMTGHSTDELRYRLSAYLGVPTG